MGPTGSDRVCVECRAPATWAVLDDDGELDRFVCDRCDRARRRRESGWWQRVAFRISRRFGI